MENQNKGNMPEMRFSTGAVNATVWKNTGHNKEGQETEFRTISFGRRYQDKEGNWKSTNSLRVNDIPKAVVVLNEAYRYLVLKEHSDPSSNNEIEVEEVFQTSSLIFKVIIMTKKEEKEIKKEEKKESSLKDLPGVGPATIEKLETLE